MMMSMFAEPLAVRLQAAAELAAVARVHAVDRAHVERLGPSSLSSLRSSARSSLPCVKFAAAAADRRVPPPPAALRGRRLLRHRHRDLERRRPRSCATPAIFCFSVVAATAWMIRYTATAAPSDAERDHAVEHRAALLVATWTPDLGLRAPRIVALLPRGIDDRAEQRVLADVDARAGVLVHDDVAGDDRRPSRSARRRRRARTGRSRGGPC